MKLVGVAGLDAHDAFALAVGRLGEIEAKVALAPSLVEAVSRETVPGKVRADVAVVVERRGGGRGDGTDGERQQKRRNRPGKAGEIMDGIRAKQRTLTRTAQSAQNPYVARMVHECRTRGSR